MTSFRNIGRIGGVGTSIGLFGLLIGGMIVILPPMAAVGVVGIVGTVLVWAMPELRSVPSALLRKTFLALVFVEICVPAYYAIQVAGLPWISIRRLVVFVAIVLLCIVVAGAKSARNRISEILSNQKAIAACVIGYALMALLSIPTSANISESIAQFTELILNWYAPFIICILVICDERDILLLYHLIAALAILVSILGIAEFVTQHRLAIDLIPRSVLVMMMQGNPSFADMVNMNPFRNGFYRASSIYTVPLSFGEFAAMTAPLGGYFVFHGTTRRDRVLGTLVIVADMLSLFVSGSRGGSVGFLVAMPLLVALWIVRYSRTHWNSLVGPAGALGTFLGTGSLIVLVFFWKRMHNIVLGGDAVSAASSDARLAQWELARPHILENPLTGHGIGTAAQVINAGGFVTIDSYILTLLVETGVPGLLLFGGLIILGTWRAARIYICDLNERATLALPLACSFVAFAIYRLALSQRENHTLFFLLIGLGLVLARLPIGGEPRAPTGQPVRPAGSQPSLVHHGLRIGTETQIRGRAIR